MKITHFFLVVSVLFAISCSGEDTIFKENVTEQSGSDQSNEENDHTYEMPPTGEEFSDVPCGTQDIELVDPENSEKNIIITLPIPCDPNFIDLGRPAPILKDGITK